MIAMQDCPATEFRRGQEAVFVMSSAVEVFCIAVLINNDEETLYVCK